MNVVYAHDKDLISFCNYVISIKENIHDTIIGNTRIKTFDPKSTLILLALHEPWCQQSKTMIQKLEQAAQRIQDKFDSFQFAIENHISPPVIGKMDTSSLTNADLMEFFQLFDSTDNALPALKFVFIERHDGVPEDYHGDIDGDHHDDNDDINNYDYNETWRDEDRIRLDADETAERTIVDFVGESNTAEDIVATIMHYWYRFVISGYVSRENAKITESDVDIPLRPIFTFSSLDSLSRFFGTHSDVFNAAIQRLTSVSDREEKYIRKLLEVEKNQDPYLAFVQCRVTQSPSYHDSINLHEQFDDLAQTYIHRRDVVFCVVTSTNCDWIRSSYMDDEPRDGFIRVVKFDQSSFNGDEPKWTYGNFYPNSYSELTMTQFVIVHSTPSVLWFDKTSSASLAFPIYRETHVVLFIDMHTPRLKDGSFIYSSSAYTQSKNAIMQLQKTAKNHQEESQYYYYDDVVFLIVPSTETQLLNTFGIDIWSSLDDACKNGTEKECYPEFLHPLPMAMITSRRENKDATSRYYLYSEELKRNDGRNPIQKFLRDYFAGSLVREIKSEPKSAQTTLSSGVQVLTGNTFDELVMQNNKHSLVQFYAPYCGHCKRFNVIWHTLAQTIQKFNWNVIIDVMMIDITKNDVYHHMVDIHEIPAVYMFPKGKKDAPIEMKIEGDEDVDSILEWMIESNIFDDEQLYSQITLSE